MATGGQETQHRLIVLPASLEMPQRQANYTVPNLLSPHFIGREEVLLGLSEHFAGSTERHTPRFAALWSMPGVGKSQIAYKFADDHRVDYIDILYFRATTVAQLLSDYRVAATLVLPEHERPDRKDIEEEKRLVQLLQRWFAKNSGWLLIFDNVQKGVDVLPFIPASGDGDIIFTTRNEYLAMSLAPNIKTYKIELLGHSQSVEMVIKIGNYGDDYRDIAGKIANAVGHLPIAIHQSITLSKAHDLSLVTLLNTLEARMPDVMYKEVASALYESSPSTGILFDLAFDMLAKSDPHAAALFKVLIFLDTSSISLGLLRTGGPQISSYLNRPVAYDRGVNRTSAELKLRAQGITDGAPTERTAAIKLYSQLQEEEAKSFRSKLRRSLKAGLPLKSKDAPLTEGLNDRAESDVDKMLRIYLSRDGNLHDVLAAPNLIERSIVSLVNAGLVSNNGMGVYSIHDLVRDLNIARIKKKSKISHEVNSLFALVLVFLAFPIPSRLPLKVADICFQYHSHALSVLRHCKETCFDATAGPEIMHLLASVLDMSDHVIHGDIEEEDAIYWYSQAHKGYVMAAKRERDSKNLFKILREVQEDFDGEVRGACFKRIVEGYERFGQAPRRAIDTALKIGTIALRKNDSTTAQKWLALAVKGYKALLGENHWFVFETLGILASACVIGLEYDDALKCSEQRALLQQEHLGGMSETSGGAGLSLTIGRLLELMRRYDEALRWLHLALSTIDTVWSEGSVKRVSTMLSIARVKRKLGQHAESRDLCAGSLEIQWLSDQEWTRPDPTLYCDALCDFAVSLDALGMSEQAAEELSGALVILKTQFGEYDELAHPITVKYLHPVLQRLAWNLARILSAGGRESQIAEQVSGKLLEHAEERFGPFKGIDFKVNPNLILATDWVQPL
ncbi:MAG: hypothetical protein M1829_004126 [Trizodia sp. TS-e1964]|nr:MAG: hypothetical protein M1829_004126 [Trizodia sp. TS-e1964]